jgi:Zn-dependent protease with chaperone function
MRTLFPEIIMKTTTQKRERFERLIKVAEDEIQEHPRRYNVKVALLALLGYVVIFGTLLVLVTIVGGIGWAVLASSTLLIMLVKTKLILVLVAMIYVLMSALWVKFGKPTGYILKQKEYPQFFSELKLLSRKLSAPRVHQVIITPEYNAAILQTPRLGIFGFYKNTLFLGLQLMMSMSPEQVSSVIAHELGHLSGKHSRFSGWIYRVRLSWHRIMVGLEQQRNFGANLLRRFFDWYSPTFAAYSFALARSNEYSADAIAAQLTSSQNVAHALVNCHVVNQLVAQYYWQPFIKQAEQVPEPKGSPYSQLASFLQQNVFDESAVHEQLQKALSINTGNFDTHPALKDRLSAIQSVAMLPEPVALSAAQHWFGQYLSNIVNYFDDQWLQHNASNWQERYNYFEEGRNKLADLKIKPIEDISSEEFWQLAVLSEEFVPDQDCLPLFELYKAKYPEDAKADFVIGRLFLARNDESGIDYLLQAMNKQQNLKLDACGWLINFYRGKNDTESADYWQLQAESQIDINAAAKKEREVISIKDDLLMPDATTGIDKHIGDQIKALKGIKQAWLVEKKMQHYPEVKTYILAFSKKWLKSEKVLIHLIVCTLELEGVCFVVMKGGKQKKIAKQVMQRGIRLF